MANDTPVPSREAVEEFDAQAATALRRGTFKFLAGAITKAQFLLHGLLAEVERLNTHAERLSRINREVLAESELLSATVAQLERTVSELRRKYE